MVVKVQELRSGSRGPPVLVNGPPEDVPSTDPPSFRAGDEAPVGHKNLGRAVTRSFFEFARPARPRRPRRGMPAVQWARHLFREHCQATPEPMSHLRTGGMYRRIMGTAGESQGSAISRLGAVSRNPRGVARASMFVRGFRAGLSQPRRKPARHAADRNKCTLQVQIPLRHKSVLCRPIAAAPQRRPRLSDSRLGDDSAIPARERHVTFGISEGIESSAYRVGNDSLS
jgi:hypothetical protein